MIMEKRADQPKMADPVFNAQGFENTSNLWSETITVSDEFSEIKPDPAYLEKLGVQYDPNELQEPFFQSQEEIKRAF